MQGRLVLEVGGIRQHWNSYLLHDLCQSGQVSDCCITHSKCRSFCCGFSVITEIHLSPLPDIESAVHMERKGICTMWSCISGGMIRENSSLFYSTFLQFLYSFRYNKNLIEFIFLILILWQVVGNGRQI